MQHTLYWNEIFKVKNIYIQVVMVIQTLVYKKLKQTNSKQATNYELGS